jgi:hypothetical protein
MSSTDNPAADNFLDSYVEAARRQFSHTEIEHAAQRLRERLPRENFGRRKAVRWLSLAAAASVVFAAVTAVSFLLPGQTGGAFAQAQQWFSTFSTLRVETTAQVGQETVSQMTFWLNAAGDVRIEAAGATTIIKASTDTIYIVPPDGQAITQGIPANGAANDATGWLDDIRDFQGQAELLAESRLIDGISAVGYAIDVGSTTFALWVDPFDGRPLLVEAKTPGTSVRHALSFNVPLPAGAFDVPDVVQPVGHSE